MQFIRMKLHRLLILGAAAWAGTMLYKLQYTPSDSSGGRSLYSSVTGPGSLGKTVHASVDSRSAAGGAASGKQSNSPAVEDMAPDDMELIQAAAKGDKNMVERRLSVHVKIDSRDAMRRTPLMYAGWNGYDDIANRLIAAGANPELRDRDGNNAFDYAASRGLMDSLHFLLQRTGAQGGERYREYALIMQATYAGDATGLPEGAGRLATINRLNPEGNAPLHIAAGNGSVALMAAMLHRGAQVNIASASRQTPLHWAAWNNQAQAAAYLIAQGADIAAADAAGNTPLLLAAQNGAADAAKVLMAQGANRYAANKEGKTPSIVAEDKGFDELAKLLK